MSARRRKAISMISDEPSRVALITSSLFANQSGHWKREISDDQHSADVSLILGADARDDCAVYRISGDVEMVVGSDYVRGPKFTMYELGLLSLYDLGYYLVIANLSDIAAMGAVPAAFLSVVRYPRDLSDSQFLELMTGIKDACELNGVLNVGGDIGSAERIILSGNAVGFCPPKRSLVRATAQPGDSVFLSGPTGIAGAAMHFFARRGDMAWQIRPDLESRLLESWKRPRAEIGLGILLSQRSDISSCADTSDGLRATVEHIAAAASVSIEIDESVVPIDDSVAAVARLAGKDPLEFVFGDSVDFRLLFTGPSSLRMDLQNSGVFEIGRVVPGPEASWLRTVRGATVHLPGVAWRHQVAPPSL